MSKSQSKRLLVLGAGGHGKVVADAARASGQWDEIAFLDDRYPALGRVAAWPVVGRFADARALVTEYPQAALGVGDNRFRAELLQTLQSLGFALPAIVHPTAALSPDARVGSGVVIFAQAVVNIDAVLKDGVIVNSAAVVEHDCQVGTACHISPGAALAGGVQVDDLSWIGMGAVVRQGVRIGRHVHVGAGAAVISDVVDGETVVGVPAHPMEDKE